MADPHLELKVVGGRGGLDLVNLLVFFPSVISSFLPKIRRGARAPPLDPPLHIEKSNTLMLNSTDAMQFF